jgi:hypothetical protein
MRPFYSCLKISPEFLPLVLLPDEVLLGQVDEVDHRLGRDEQMLVQNFNLKK